MWAEKENIVSHTHSYTKQPLFSTEPASACPGGHVGHAGCQLCPGQPSRASDGHLGLLCALQCCVWVLSLEQDKGK